jgi:hypothetical protein
MIVDDRDLGIGTGTPLVSKIAELLGIIIYLLFLNPVAFFITDLLWIVLSALVISHTLRDQVQRGLLGVAVVVLLVLVAVVWGAMLNAFLMGWFNRLVFGRPIFGKVGGADRASFFAALRASRLLHIEIDDADRDLAREFNRLDMDVTKYLIHQNYNAFVEKHFAADPDSRDRALGEWEDVWEKKLLDVGLPDYRLRDAFDLDNLAYRVVPLKLTASASLISPLLKFFQLAMIYLVARVLNFDSPVITAVQVAVFLTLILSILWNIYHSYRVSELEFAGNYETLPPDVREQFAERFAPYLGRSLSLRRVTVDQEYYALVRSYQMRYILITALNTILMLVWVGLLLLIALVIPSVDRSYLFTWYRDLSLGILLIPLVFYLGFYLVSIFVHSFRSFLAALVAGAVSALLPFGLTYLATGDFEFGDVNSALSSIVAGLGVTIATLIVTNLTSSLSGDG